MAARAAKTDHLAPDAERVLTAMGDARERTLGLLADVSDEDLERVHSPIMSPLVWDVGHIAAYEDLWLAHRLGGIELLRPELANLYDAFETPRAIRGEIEALGPADARAYAAAVRERTAAILVADGPGDGFVCEMVLRHELQHTETMRQTMAIAGLLPAGEPPLGRAERGGGWVAIAAGAFSMGAGEDGFAYDNERPRHVRELDAFEIAALPASNQELMRFSEEGGYERREGWCEEGWAWRRAEQIGLHRAVREGDPRAPACHISWFEADAFARACGARLPSEAEWERAAGEIGDAGTHGGAIAGVGQVWEWTGSRFDGYPGFSAYPYREYSQVFFGAGYRVLRGGSWATHPRVACRTFRNWDLPVRRQIFSGVRLARDC